MTKLTEIIQFAIDREIEAESFYLAVAAKTTKETLRELFTGFAAEENNHQKLLKGVLKNKETVLQFKQASDYKISETVAQAVLTDEMSIADVFSIAMKNEEAAMKMYQKLAGDSTSEDSRRLFESLAVMEQGHKVKMEEYYTDVAYSEVW
jgi:rubrerythrin